MKRTHDDCTIELAGKPIQQLARRWADLSREEAAEAFQETFTEASILPNAAVLVEAVHQAQTYSTMPVALMAVNDDWSVYAVGPCWIAVNTYKGEPVAFSDLEPGDFERMNIPVPKG